MQIKFVEPNFRSNWKCLPLFLCVSHDVKLINAFISHSFIALNPLHPTHTSPADDSATVFTTLQSLHCMPFLSNYSCMCACIYNLPAIISLSGHSHRTLATIHVTTKKKAKRQQNKSLAISGNTEKTNFQSDEINYS